MRLKSKSAVVFMFAALGALGYFTWHGLHGSRGVERVAELKLEVGRLKEQLAGLREQRLALERRVVLLRPESIDPDMLDEEARASLGFVHENDRSIPVERNGGMAHFVE
ncbi:FtsB family cell division protein [Rhodoligotrophos defluvii]|uniref:FtsB family cell division protein n=1 Tax=Rhodoligotrophos defluvii TaxID=2561934 RepID=UPI00195F3211|nr:septum formation initiator family protein [Rhodoligotrophos defluvii]